MLDMHKRLVYSSSTVEKRSGDTKMSNQIAQTILNQLGGHRFIVMTGAKNLTSSESALTFKLPNRFAKDGINVVRITLSTADLYDVDFMKWRGMTQVHGKHVGGVYADQLREIFTAETGLDTSMGTMRGAA